MAPPRGGAAIGGILEQIEALVADGLLLAAHDLAREHLEAGVDDDRLRHSALTTLQRCGATGMALDLFERWHLHASGNPEIATVHAHLLKDRALHNGNPEAADDAAEAFTALWRRTGKAWLGVNAASMALLAGDTARARALASALGEIPDTGNYWSAATAAEAALLRGKPDEAHWHLVLAERRAGTDLTARATTRRQLRWQAARLGADPALIEALVIPSVLHYTASTPTEAADETATRALIEAALQGAGFAYGGLAAGGEIMIAEALIARGAQLHIRLPCPVDEYAARFAAPFGDRWLERFYRAAAACRDLVELEPKFHDDWSSTMASRRAMGLAKLRAQQLETGVRQLALWDGSRPAAASGTAVDIDAWSAANVPTSFIPCPWPKPEAGKPAPRPPRQPRAVLFGDLPGFGNLDDAELAAFYGQALEPVAEAVAAERPDYRNAWGDAVQCVFTHPNAAARCALGIRAALSPAALARHGLPVSLTPRLALDHGALLPVHDPVQKAAKFAGTVMTRAARIEPVTPPGRIYATEAFACEMALEPFPAVTCDYAGNTRTAKNYGTLPLYAVRPAAKRA
jgi:hypothetical protein